MIYPVSSSYPVTQGYGNTDVPDGVTYKTHAGIDYGTPIGTNVVAAGDGVVEKAGRDTTGYGVMVRIRHDGGLSTIYAHLQQAMVQTGDNVTQGQVIGRTGNTGNSTGPHLHFEVRRNNKAVDPASVIAATTPPPAPVQSLPIAKYMRSQGQNIRSQPSIMGDIVGTILPGMVVGVIAVTAAGADEWALLVGTPESGYWAAVRYQGQVFLEDA